MICVTSAHLFWGRRTGKSSIQLLLDEALEHDLDDFSKIDCLHANVPYVSCNRSFLLSQTYALLTPSKDTENSTVRS